MKIRILFVDDEPNILKMLKHLLQSTEEEWEPAFASSGEEALALMKDTPFDVVVSDLNMPGMNGAELLRVVDRDYPSTTRFVFTGATNMEESAALVHTAHQFFLKPDDIRSIRSAISNAHRLQRILPDKALETVVARITTLPSLPKLYHQVVREMESSDASIDRIGVLIGQDIAMSAKVLKMVNSAFFGLRKRVSSPAQAASLLGLEVLKALVLAVHIFSERDGIAVEGFTLETLWTHSLSCALMAKDISACEGGEGPVLEAAFLSGLFHDIGKLVLMANLPQEYARSIRLAKSRRIRFVEAEREIMQATHAEVGAYLLGLWGFADDVVESTAFHHFPLQAPTSSFGALTVAHVANVLDREVQPSFEGEYVEAVDEQYLSVVGKLDRLETWRTCCGKMQQKAEATYHEGSAPLLPGDE